MLEAVFCAAGVVIGFLAGYQVRTRRDHRAPAHVPAPDAVVIVPPAGPEPAEQESIEPKPGERGPELIEPDLVEPESVEPEPEPVEPESESESVEPVPRPKPPGDLDAVRAVLDVADRITNPELSRRLAEAVVRLPGVTAIRPRPGEAFEPREHEWVAGRATRDRERWDTVAEIRAPGATASGLLLRAAHVVVFEPPEES